LLESRKFYVRKTVVNGSARKVILSTIAKKKKQPRVE
jgi:hypothetical protein